MTELHDRMKALLEELEPLAAFPEPSGKRWWQQDVPELVLALDIVFDPELSLPAAQQFFLDMTPKFSGVQVVLLYRTVRRYIFRLLDPQTERRVLQSDLPRVEWVSIQALIWLDLAGYRVGTLEAARKRNSAPLRVRVKRKHRPPMIFAPIVQAGHPYCARADDVVVFSQAGRSRDMNYMEVLMYDL